MLSLPDWFLIGGAGLGILGLAAVGEWLHNRGWSGGSLRRLVHGSVCLFVAATPWVFEGPGPVGVLAGVFVLVTIAAWRRDWWPGVHAACPQSWGTVTIPVAVVAAVAATWFVDPSRLFAFQLSFLVLAVADPVGAWVGERWGQRHFMETATLRGTLSFAIVTFLIVGTGLIGSGWERPRAVLAASVTASVAGVAEAIWTRGWDHLFVVLAVLLVLVPLQETVTTLGALGSGLLLGGGTALVAHRTAALTKRGALGAGLFAASLVGLGGWAWLVPGFLFFGLSSALSYLPEPGSSSGGRPPRRTFRQVLANGGGGWALLAASVVIPGSDGASFLLYGGFVGGLAAAAADTWATELGARYGSRPWSLRTFRLVRHGRSGAISGLGTLAGAAGASVVAGSAVMTPGSGLSIWHGGLCAVAGLGGMLVDSIAGATVQAHYETGRTNEVVERRVRGARLARGISLVDNDVVNVICTIVGAALAVVLLVIL